MKYYKEYEEARVEFLKLNPSWGLYQETLKEYERCLKLEKKPNPKNYEFYKFIQNVEKLKKNI